MKLKLFTLICLSFSFVSALSAQSMESDFYITTEPLRYFSRTVNLQYGFKSQADKLAYWQIGASSTLGKDNLDVFSSFFNIIDLSEHEVEKRLNLAIDIQYRIIVKKRNFWAPFITGYVDHFVFRNTKTFERFNTTTTMVGAGVINGRFYNNNNKSLLGALYWGVGASYIKDGFFFPSPDGGNNMFAPIIMLGWQFGVAR